MSPLATMEPQADASPVSEELLERAREAARRYYAQCFWFWHPDAQIRNRADVRAVIENLREYGDHKAWWVAQDLHQCL